MKRPENIWKFNPPQTPLNIEFSNSKHLLIEGSPMDMNVGVYQVEKTAAGEILMDPIKVLASGARGLTCQVAG